MSDKIYQAFWNEVLRLIREEYIEKNKEDEYKIWFNMEYVRDTLTEITVAVPSDFMWAKMVELGYVGAVEDKITELTGQKITVNYIAKNKIKNSKPVSPEEKGTKESVTISAPTEISVQVVNTESPSENIIRKTEQKTLSETEEPTARQETRKTHSYIPVFSALENPEEEESKAEKDTENSKIYPSEFENHYTLKKHPQLREEYTFESFVPGENSEFLYNACLAIAKNPGIKWNPLLIYGGVGLGKTHLMQSIGNYLYKERNGNIKICYISAENFTNEFTNSIREGTTDKFKAKYRKLDLLLLDDIHFLQDKEATQEELFHTFEALDGNKSQMVFTCDRPITELKGIEDRLRTRFTHGLSIDLIPPNYETRRAILQKKLNILEKNIPADVVDYIAKYVQTNVRDLESCMQKIVGYAELLSKPLTIEIAQKQLRDIFSQPASGSISVETIQKVVADHYNISLSDIKSKKRNKKFVIPRQIAIYIARQITEFSFPELGNEFGGRDHTTAMHSYEKVVDQLKTDSVLDTTIQMLIREIKDYKK